MVGEQERPSLPSAGDGFVQSLARGLEVITVFDHDHAELTLSEVAARTGLTRATVRRLLLTLVQLGYATQVRGRFALTPRVLRLGHSYLSGLGLPRIAEPHLRRLSDDLGESSSVAVLDGPEISYVARVATRRIMTVDIAVGSRFPAYATSLGRVLLAGLDADQLKPMLDRTVFTRLTDRTVTDRATLLATLDKVRSAGHAIVDQELEPGLRSAAAPIRDGRRRVVAAVNISTLVTRGSAARMPAEHVQRLKITAADISGDLADLTAH